MAAVALSILIWWQLSPRNRYPVIQFRVLHNRDLVASILLFVVLGFGLYGGVFIFPALHADHPRLLADRDRPGDDARRHRHGGAWRSSAAGCSTATGRWSIRES